MAVHEIAKVAVVFGVNVSVPTTNVTDHQICDVYGGRITNWKQLGGPDLAIAPRTRPDSEVDAEVVRGKVACLADMKMPEGVKVMASTRRPYPRVTATRALPRRPRALGPPPVEARP